MFFYNRRSTSCTLPKNQATCISFGRYVFVAFVVACLNSIRPLTLGVIKKIQIFTVTSFVHLKGNIMNQRVHDCHHRLPRSEGGRNTKENMVRVPQALHRAWHLLFRNWLPPKIAEELNKTWISRQWRMVAFAKPEPGLKKKTFILYEDQDCKVIMKEK